MVTAADLIECMQGEWGDENYYPIVCSTADKEVLEQNEKQKKALLALSRDGTQVEGPTEEGESVALALDSQQVHGPRPEEEQRRPCRSELLSTQCAAAVSRGR